MEKKGWRFQRDRGLKNQKEKEVDLYGLMLIEIDYIYKELSNQNNRKDKSKVRYFKYKKLRHYKQEYRSKQKEEQM